MIMKPLMLRDFWKSGKGVDNDKWRNTEQKYRWHDLRKDPDDLPNDDSIEYIVCVEYQNGRRECTIGCLDMGGDMMLLPTLGNWIGNGYHIIAWREIEPFEGV